MASAGSKTQSLRAIMRIAMLVRMAFVRAWLAGPLTACCWLRNRWSLPGYAAF